MIVRQGQEFYYVPGQNDPVQRRVAVPQPPPQVQFQQPALGKVIVDVLGAVGVVGLGFAAGAALGELLFGQEKRIIHCSDCGRSGHTAREMSCHWAENCPENRKNRPLWLLWSPLSFYTIAPLCGSWSGKRQSRRKSSRAACRRLSRRRRRLSDDRARRRAAVDWKGKSARPGRASQSSSLSPTWRRGLSGGVTTFFMRTLGPAMSISTRSGRRAPPRGCSRSCASTCRHRRGRN